MRKKQSVAKGFAILSMAGIINKFLALVYVPIQTMIVGNVGNGIISAGYRIYVFIFFLSNAGIPVAISKIISEQTALGNFRDSQKTLKVAGSLLLLLGISASIFMAAGARWLTGQIAQPRAYLMILALSPTLLFTAVSSLFRGYFQGRSDMAPTAISQIIEQALNSTLTVIFAALFIKYGIDKAAAGTTIGTSVGALGAALYLSILYLKNRKQFREEVETSNYSGPHAGHRQILKRIILYGTPLVLGTIALNVNDLIDLRLSVGRMLAGGIEHRRATELFGILSYQYQRILNVPLSITAALQVALIPAVSAANALKNTAALNKKINDAFKIVLMITVPAATALAVLPEPIITFIFFSLRYNQGADLMRLGSWVIILLAVISIQTAVIIGIGRPYIPPLNMLAAMVVKGIVNYFLIAVPAINVKGAIIGSLLGYSITCVLNQYALKRLLRITLNFKRLVPIPLAASIIMSLAAYAVFHLLTLGLKPFIHSALLLNDICLLVSIVAGLFVYVFSLIYMNGVKYQEIERLPMGAKINRFLSRWKFLDERLRRQP